MRPCVFCGTMLKECRGEGIYQCECPNCGSYRISSDAFNDLYSEFKGRYRDVRHLVAGYIRECNDSRMPLEPIMNSNFDSLARIANTKRTTGYKLDRALLLLYKRMDYLGQAIDISRFTDACFYARNEAERENIYLSLKDMGYITGFSSIRSAGGFNNVKLTLRGIEKAESLIHEETNSSYCFVAMWFNDEMLTVYDRYIKNAIIDTGFEPMITVNQEHNNDICDEIIAGIKKSKFIIADFTGQRPSVYYEAGMAFGLGLPVIWTCREDWFDSLAEVEKHGKVDGKTVKVQLQEERKVHFDVSHNKFIVWRDGEELYRKLVNRIEATVK